MLEEVHNQTQIDVNGEIQRAVICVPANTTDVYREEVYKAAEMAGLGEKDDNGSVIKDDLGHPLGVSLLEEPTAAAIEYGRQMEMWKEKKEQTILVYDMGGGTFDVTILSVDSTGDLPKFKIVATQGIAKLGGDDFDHVLMEMCAEEFKANTVDIDIFDLKSDQNGTSAKELKKAQQKLQVNCEQAKIAFAGGKKRGGN